MTNQIGASVVIERTYKADAAELWALWTTSAGFQSWWGPQGFRADVRTIEPRLGGALHYAMIADMPEMVEAMARMGQPVSTECRGSFTGFSPNRRLELTQRIDFLPGVKPYDSVMVVDFLPQDGGRIRMTISSSPMHDAAMTTMQQQGLASQLTKIDQRYG